MRISDWSSDVCSSDLALAVEVQRFFARDAPRDVRHVDHAVDVARQADEQTEFGRVLDFAFDDRADRMGVRKGAPGVRLGLLEAKRDAALVAVDFEDDDVDFLRSEEHTSELQSLMRISYAVFCLKKKKRNNTKTQSYKG